MTLRIPIHPYLGRLFREQEHKFPTWTTLPTPKSALAQDVADGYSLAATLAGRQRIVSNMNTANTLLLSTVKALASANNIWTFPQIARIDRITDGQAFTDDAVAVAQYYRPKWMTLAVEINVIEGWMDRHRDLLERVVEAVAVVSPHTLCGVSINYQDGIDDDDLEAWIASASWLPCVFITDYPQLHLAAGPAPDSAYYDRLIEAIREWGNGRPWGFSECGWYTRSPSSETQQIKYLRLLDSMRDPMPTVIVYYFLHDVNGVADWTGGNFFFDMGLYDQNGAAKASAGVYQAFGRRSL